MQGPAGVLSTWRVAALVGVIGVVAYANALGNGFAYDDVHIVVDDAQLGDLRELRERLLLPYWPEDAEGELGLWRPLTTATLGVQKAVVGLNPLVFHALNVLLHGLVSALVVVLASVYVPIVGAGIAGLLFALHPVHVEAVSNVVGLAELLPAALYLLACILFLGWTSRDYSGEGGGVGPGRTLLLCFLFALAFLGKESAITLPAALIVLESARRPTEIGALGGYLRQRGPLLASLAVTAFLLLFARYSVLGSIADPDAPLGADLLAEIPRSWTLGVIWFEYVRLMLWPWSLSVDYSPDVIPILTVWTPRGIAGVGLALAALFGSWWSWRRSIRLPALAVLWFVVTLSPVTNVLFLTGVLLAERTLYLPSVGFAVLAGGVAAWGFTRARQVTIAVVTAVSVLFLARTWTRTPTWQSTETVFATLLEEHPEAGRSQWILGDVLRERGDEEAARRSYARAIGTLDRAYRLMMEVGWDAVEDGDEELGEYLMLQAWRDRPEQSSAPRRLTVLYSQLGQHEKVVEFGRHTVRLAPEDVASWHLLSASLAVLGQWDDAIGARRTVLELGEDHWQQWVTLARLYLTVGNVDEAEAARDEALARTGDPAEQEYIRAAFQPFVLDPGGAG